MQAVGTHRVLELVSRAAGAQQSLLLPGGLCLQVYWVLVQGQLPGSS